MPEHRVDALAAGIRRRAAADGTSDIAMALAVLRLEGRA